MRCKSGNIGDGGWVNGKKVQDEVYGGEASRICW